MQDQLTLRTWGLAVPDPYAERWPTSEDGPYNGATEVGSFTLELLAPLPRGRFSAKIPARQGHT
jgi:hypothetical protein